MKCTLQRVECLRVDAQGAEHFAHTRLEGGSWIHAENGFVVLLQCQGGTQGILLVLLGAGIGDAEGVGLIHLDMLPSDLTGSPS